MFADPFLECWRSLLIWHAILPGSTGCHFYVLYWFSWHLFHRDGFQHTIAQRLTCVRLHREERLVSTHPQPCWAPCSAVCYRVRGLHLLPVCLQQARLPLLQQQINRNHWGPLRQYFQAQHRHKKRREHHWQSSLNPGCAKSQCRGFICHVLPLFHPNKAGLFLQSPRAALGCA